MMYIFMTGRETNIAQAELESVFDKIEIINGESVLIDCDNLDLPNLNKLGFTKKVSKIVNESFRVDSMAEIIAQAILQCSKNTTGKIPFGISWYSKQASDQKMYLTLSKNVKKRLQSSGRSARFIPPKDNFRLNAAQVHYNALLKKGSEIVVFDNGNNLSIAKTVWEFDPDEYSRRDYDRPARDSKVGMFPPKLAQVLINLASPSPNDLVVDPFCGSGVVLQEAMMSGYDVIGSDNSAEMAKASNDNLAWFKTKFSNPQDYDIYLSDAAKFKAPRVPYVIVSEGYLGPAFASPVTEQELTPILGEISKLYIDFLSHLKAQSNQPKSVVITLPCWQTTKELKMLNIIDQIQKLGYTLKQFKSAPTDSLIYKRDTQTVGRQIVVLEP